MTEVESRNLLGDDSTPPSMVGNYYNTRRKQVLAAMVELPVNTYMAVLNNL